MLPQRTINGDANRGKTGSMVLTGLLIFSLPVQFTQLQYIRWSTGMIRRSIRVHNLKYQIQHYIEYARHQEQLNPLSKPKPRKINLQRHHM